MVRLSTAVPCVIEGAVWVGPTGTVNLATEVNVNVVVIESVSDRTVNGSAGAGVVTVRVGSTENGEVTTLIVVKTDVRMTVVEEWGGVGRNMVHREETYIVPSVSAC